MIEVRTPANQFFDTDGSPLDNGYIYIGTTGANPETTPQAVYWDKAGTIPAAQPIRTINGFPARDGAVSKFYTTTKNYSITVKDKRGILVMGVLNSDSGVFDELSSTSGAAGVGYDGTTSGLSSSNVQDAIDEVQSNVDSVVAAQNSQSGLVNLFMNSAFMINTRGYVSGTATTGANQYTIDRIRVVVSGQSLTFTAAAFGNKITAPAGGAEQVIEGIFIVGGDYACTWTGTGTIQVNGVTKAKNETFSLSAGANATIRMFGEFEKFVLTRPDMLGRYEYDYSRDLITCRRYAVPMPLLIPMQVYSGSAAFGTWSTPSQMRALPAITGSGFQVHTSVAAAVACTLTVTSMVGNAIRFDVTAASGLVAGNATMSLSPSGAYLSAEL